MGNSATNANEKGAKLLKIKNYDGLHNILTVIAPDSVTEFTYDVTFIDEGQLYFGMSHTSDEQDLKLHQWCTIREDDLVFVSNGKLAKSTPNFGVFLEEVNEIANILRGSGNLKQNGYVR